MDKQKRKKVGRVFKTTPCNVKINISCYKRFSIAFCLRAGRDVLFVFAGYSA